MKPMSALLISSLALTAFGAKKMIVYKGGVNAFESTVADVDSIKFVDIPVVITPVPAMMTIPAGTFLYQGTISIDVKSFQMSKYETTQKEYQLVMGVHPSGFTGDENRPVETVTWFDAVLYCNARSKADGKDSVYTYTSKVGSNPCTVLAGLAIDSLKNGYYLPTDVQWEYACRGGTTSTYFWGNDSDDATVGQYAWYSSNSGSTTHTVGGKLPNAFGLYDMSGNVWE